MYFTPRQREIILFAVGDLLMNLYFENSDEFPEEDYDEMESIVDKVQSYTFDA